MLGVLFVPQGETVCTASCLYFDNENTLQGFLSLSGNHRFRHRIVAARGLMHDGETMRKPIYVVLIGLAQSQEFECEMAV